MRTLSRCHCFWPPGLATYAAITSTNELAVVFSNDVRVGKF